MSELKHGKHIEKIGKRKRVATYFGKPTKTQQQFKDDVDVNLIMEKYKRTGSITHVRNVQQGVYADLTQISDYASSLMQIKHAEEAFLSMPSSLRVKFNNNPAQLISFLSDPKNHEEAINLGLVLKPKNENPPENENPPQQDPPQQPSKQKA